MNPRTVTVFVPLCCTMLAFVLHSTSRTIRP